MEVVDAQVHVWPREAPDRPWIPTAASFSHGEEFTVESLLAQMDQAGVDAAILVPPSFEGDRNDYCLKAAMEWPERFAVMGRVTVPDQGAQGSLATWRDQPGMLGIRLTFSLGETRAWIRDGTADWVFAEAEQHGVPLMVWAPGQVPEVARMARRHPGARLVLDHLALGVKLRDEQMDPVLEEVVAELADLPNVAVKATCLPSYVEEPYPFPSLHPRIRRVVEAFGPRRVFWGSDVSRLFNGTYEECRRLFTDALDGVSAEDLEWIMGRGLRTWLGWPRADSPA